MIKFTRIKKVREGLKIALGVLILLFGLLSFLNDVQVWILELFFVFLGVLQLREVFIKGFRVNRRDFIVSMGLLFFGLVPCILNLDLLWFLPMVIDLDVSSWVLALVLIFYGLYVVVDNILDFVGF